MTVSIEVTQNVSMREGGVSSWGKGNGKEKWKLPEGQDVDAEPRRVRRNSSGRQCMERRYLQVEEHGQRRGGERQRVMSLSL